MLYDDGSRRLWEQGRQIETTNRKACGTLNRSVYYTFNIRDDNRLGGPVTCQNRSVPVEARNLLGHFRAERDLISINGMYNSPMSLQIVIGTGEQEMTYSRSAMGRGVLALAAVALVGSAAAQESGTLEEVIVTAQKREQSINDIGITVSVLSAADLENFGVRTAEEIVNFMPNVELFEAGYTGLNVFVVRGVGLLDENPNNTPTNSMYADDVYLPYNVMMPFAMFDAERVEVLRGPQGGLYGRNTTGGALNFVSRRPNFEQTEGNISVDAGNFGYVGVQAGLSVPLSDTAAARFAVQYDESDGYYRNTFLNTDVGGVDRLMARATLSYQPSESFSADLRLVFGKDESEEGLPEVSGHLDPDALFDFGGAFGLPSLRLPWDPESLLAIYCPSVVNGGLPDANCINNGGLVADGMPHTGVDDEVFRQDTEFSSAALNLAWEFASISLLSITAVQDYSSINPQADGVVAPVNVDPAWDNLDLGGYRTYPLTPFINQQFNPDIQAFSQELRLLSSGDTGFNWMVGAMYADDDLELESPTEFFGNVGWNILQFPGGGTMGYTQKTEAWSVYAQVAFDLSDQWALTVDARYTDEQKDYSGWGYVNDGPMTCALVFGAGTDDDLGGFTCREALGIDADNHFSLTGAETITSSYDQGEPSWKVNLDYRLNEVTLVYASIGQGFKSGGFFGGWLVNPSVEAYKPEKNLASEIGFKSTLADGRMQLNGALFRYDYTDWQGLLNIIDGNTGAAFLGLTTLGDQETTGAEIDLRWLPSDGWDIRFGLGWLNTEITEMAPPPDLGPGSSVAIVDETNTPVDVVGNSAPFAPELTMNAMIRYDFAVSSTMMAALQFDGSYSDDFYLNVANTRWGEEDGYERVNARVELYSADNRWRVALWGRNLTDSIPRVALYNDGLDNFWQDYGAPRTYGVTLGYNF